MHILEEKIRAAREAGRTALIPFVTAGFPDEGSFWPAVRELDEGGADIIEIGIPFSDPIAEGPVIQAADVRALSNRITTDDIFDMAERIRAGGCDVPLAVMTYMNPVFVYGPDRFMERCARAGICAVIVPDVPYEEKGFEPEENLEAYLGRLDGDTQTIIRLRFFEELSLAEIARITELNLNTVKARLYRGLKRLRIDIQEVGL